MDEALWYLTHQSRKLQQFRAEIHGFWDDDAARDLSFRFLNPHQRDDEQMLVSLHQHQNALLQTQSQLARAHDCAVQAELISQEVNELLYSCAQEVRMSYQFYEQYRRSHSIAVGLLPEVERLIAEANSACRGVPTK